MNRILIAISAGLIYLSSIETHIEQQVPDYSYIDYLFETNPYKGQYNGHR